MMEKENSITLYVFLTVLIAEVSWAVSEGFFNTELYLLIISFLILILWLSVDQSLGHVLSTQRDNDEDDKEVSLSE